MATGTPLLEVDKLRKNFAGVLAVDNVSFDVRDNEIVGLIGPNGAGKTTVINLLTALIPSGSGTVRFAGEDVSSCPTHVRVHAGMTRTFQAPVVFESLTVNENVASTLVAREGFRFHELLMGTPQVRKAAADANERARELVDFVGLSGVGEALAGELAYGHRKILGIALGLAARPRVLLMDEPTAGLSPAEKEDVADLLQRIRNQHISLVVVEHDMKLIMGVCDRIVVLNYGKKIAQGTPAEVQKDKVVIDAYLGGVDDAVRG